VINLGFRIIDSYNGLAIFGNQVQALLVYIPNTNITQ